MLSGWAEGDTTSRSLGEKSDGCLRNLCACFIYSSQIQISRSQDAQRQIRIGLSKSNSFLVWVNCYLLPFYVRRRIKSLRLKLKVSQLCTSLSATRMCAGARSRLAPGALVLVPRPAAAVVHGSARIDSKHTGLQLGLQRHS